MVARQKPWWRVRACVRSYVGQILKLRRSADDKVFMVVRVPRRDDIEVKNLWQHVGERARDSVRT